MFRIQCIACGKPYDAEKAVECDCIQPVHSLRCPHCAACFCSDKKTFDEFWRSAPPQLRQKRRDLGGPATSGTAGDVARPMVLFADDDPTSRAIAARVIATLGFGVVVAENGEQALALAREYQPELIITDALMPRLDGRELSRTVKGELPATKIVVITAVYKDPRYRHEALRDFAVDAYLNKPVNPADLRATVQKFLGSGTVRAS